MLNDILRQDYIRLGIRAKDWEEAIRISGEILKENEVVKDEYIQEAIENIRELGPYMVISNGIALPHATNKNGVIKNGVSILRLDKPVIFPNREDEPVSYIFLIATIDMESHIKILSNLSEILQKEEFINLLKKAQTSDEIIKYIKKHEKV